MATVQVAESSKPKKAAKVLAHLEIHPSLGGGHLVRHVYSGFGHEPREVKFNESGKSQGGEHIVSHLTKHAGLPGLEPYDKRNESETEEEIDA